MIKRIMLISFSGLVLLGCSDTESADTIDISGLSSNAKEDIMDIVDADQDGTYTGNLAESESADDIIDKITEEANAESDSEDIEEVETVEESTQDSDVGQRTNPAKLGEPILMLGTFEDRDANYESFDANLEMTVVDVTRGEEAWNIILDANQFNDPAPEGMEYIITRVKLKLNNATNDNLKTSFQYREFDYFSNAGSSYSFVSIVAPDELDVEMYNNGEAEGNIYGLVDIDDSPLIRFNNTFFFETE